MNALTQAAARALAEHNITCNAFAPGVVDTPLWTKLDEDLMHIGDADRPGQAMADFAAGHPARAGRHRRGHPGYGAVPGLGRLGLPDRPGDHDRRRNGAGSTSESAADTTAVNLGLQLRTARQKSGKTLRELARQLGVSPSFLSQIENGSRSRRWRRCTRWRDPRRVHRPPLRERGDHRAGRTGGGDAGDGRQRTRDRPALGSGVVGTRLGGHRAPAGCRSRRRGTALAW